MDKVFHFLIQKLDQVLSESALHQHMEMLNFLEMVPPFTPVDREADYREAWAHFEKVLGGNA